MIILEISLTLLLILFIYTIIFYILRKKEYELQKSKYFFIVCLIIMGSIFLFNVILFNPSQNSESDKNSMLLGLSLSLLLFSLWIFIKSFYISDQDVIDLEIPSRYKSRKGNIEIGKVMKKRRRRYKFFLSIKDLERHMFVCGITGSGKSNFVQNFLIKFKEHYDIPFLLAEFKGEYTFLQDIIEDLLIIRPGENFSINIFNPEGANPEIHAERVFDILKSGQFLDANSEFSPQMEKVLVDILTNVCRTSQYRSWKGFFDQCEEYLKNQKNTIPMLHQSLVSIQNRIRRFSLGPLKSIFATRYKLKIRDLFDKNILFDLSSIIRLGGEKEDALFFLNMVLKYLWDKNLTYGAYNFKGIKHLTIIEDTQYFAPKDLSLQTKLTSYLEDIALLQRGTGECLISIATRPNVSEEILANCGVLITFKNHMQRSFISELLNLDEENEDYLSILEEGECIVRTNSVKRPFLLWVPLVERFWLKRGDVNRKNKLILKKFKEKDSDIIKNKEISNHTVDKSEKVSQKIQYAENENEDISEAAEIKFFIDNLLASNKNVKEPFNPENYRKCPECCSIIEKKHKICPYCGSSFN